MRRLPVAFVAALCLAPMAVPAGAAPAATAPSGAATSSSTPGGAGNDSMALDAADKGTDRAAEHPDQGDGPHSPRNRTPEPLSVKRSGGVEVRAVDLGDIDLGGPRNPGEFRAPVRGQLYRPAHARGKAPLLVFGHLRAPACTDDLSRWPCPAGFEPMRYDLGMAYLGQALAEQGYAVLVPDLAPLYVAGALSAPYDQTTGWLRTVGGLR